MVVTSEKHSLGGDVLARERESGHRADGLEGGREGTGREARREWRGPRPAGRESTGRAYASLPVTADMSQMSLVSEMTLQYFIFL